jgi:hypothetical protein
MEEICSFETSLYFQRTTHIPEDRNLYNNFCEKLISCKQYLQLQ